MASPLLDILDLGAMVECVVQCGFAKGMRADASSSLAVDLNPRFLDPLKNGSGRF
jgi:hypothetical protein